LRLISGKTDISRSVAVPELVIAPGGPLRAAK